MKRFKEDFLVVAGVAIAYVLTGKLGLSLAFFHPSASAVWPPAGIALAALLIFGRRAWPGIFIGAFVVNVTTAGTVLTSLGIATGNTLEALLGAYLVARFADGRRAFDSGANTFRFAILAGLVSTSVAATLGVTSLSLAGFARWHDYKEIWLTWWLGDSVGDIVVAPVIILWSENWRPRWSWNRRIELLLLGATLTLVSLIVFCQLFFLGRPNYPIEYLCIPFLIWAAFRHSQREAATATLLLAAIAVWGTLHGLGPFAVGTKNESLLLLQSFVGLVAAMTMGLAAMTAERRLVEAQVRSLAVTDPLTGLANYRTVMEVIDAEIRRYDRTERPFALLMLDLDGLKSLNDRHGHLAGSRALCRLADVLRAHCRGIDTAARYGGDEFAVIIAEADAEQARLVARRIRERIAADIEEPRISASVGSAAFPADGNTRESLLEAADRALYEMKRQTAGVRKSFGKAAPLPRQFQTP